MCFFHIIAVQYASYLSPKKLLYTKHLKFDGCIIV